jgi:replicative DNA helicase
MTYQLSENVQKGILYLVKHDYNFFSQILPLVNPEFFEYPSYARIFSAVRDYYEKYKKLPTDSNLVEFIKFTTIQDSKDDNDYEDDLKQINKMDSDVLNDAEFIMDVVEDFSRRSKMKEAIKKSVALLKEDRIPEIETLVRDALLVSRNVDTGQDYFEDVQKRISRLYEKKTENRFQTLFPSVNANLEGGLCAKELAMVVAPPGRGKSLYLVNQGAVSLMEGRNVLYISCEMSEDKIGNRFDSILTKLKNSKLKEIETQNMLTHRLQVVKGRTQGKLIIKEFPTGSATVNTVRAYINQLNLHKNFKPDVIIVDYLELLRPNRSIEAEYAAQQRIAEELRGLAVEFKCLLWTASQTNRQATKVNIITDAELGDSYGKIRPADWVISLNQTQEEYDKGQMRVYVIKARDSKQNYIVPATIDYSTLKMSESHAEEPDEE